MNERIKELAFQAGFIGESMNPIIGTSQVTALENFAELIVRDICNMVNKHIQWNNPNDCPVVLDIKERYGVER